MRKTSASVRRTRHRDVGDDDRRRHISGTRKLNLSPCRISGETEKSGAETLGTNWRATKRSRRHSKPGNEAPNSRNAHTQRKQDDRGGGGLKLSAPAGTSLSPWPLSVAAPCSENGTDSLSSRGVRKKLEKMGAWQETGRTRRRDVSQKQLRQPRFGAAGVHPRRSASPGGMSAHPRFSFLPHIKSQFQFGVASVAEPPNRRPCQLLRIGALSVLF